MTRYVFLSRNEADTDRLGTALATEAPAGITIALCGTLGAGKTRLVQAVAQALGVPAGEALSPTFVMIHEYHGRRAIYHIDAYRIKDAEEFFELGVDELLESDGLVMIEWADRVRSSLPDDRLELTLEVAGPSARTVLIEGIGPKSDAAAARIAAVLGAEAQTR